MIELLKKYGLDKALLVVAAGIILILIGSQSGKKTAAGPSENANPGLTGGVYETAFSGPNQEEVSFDEARLKTILEKKYGEDNIYIMIQKNEVTSSYFNTGSNEYEGVLVMVRTADYDTATYEIVNAVTALFDVPAHKVIIMKLD